MAGKVDKNDTISRLPKKKKKILDIGLITIHSCNAIPRMGNQESKQV